MSTDDLILLQRWRRKRDAEAFRELVARHGGMVYATCRRVLRNPEDAEEIAQDCFLHLAQRSARPKTSVGGWLHALAAHRALDRIKSESRRRAREEKAAPKPGVDRDPREEMIEHVDAVLAELPENTRALLVQHFLEGRSHDEIARELDVSRSTVTRRIAAGVEQVRTRLRARRVCVPAAALTAALTGLQAEALPPALAARLGKFAMAGAGTTAASSLYAGLVAKVAVLLITCAVVGVGVVLVANRADSLRLEAVRAPIPTEGATVALDLAANDVPELPAPQESAPPVGAVPEVLSAADAGPPAAGALIDGVVLDLANRPVPGARVDCSGVGRDFPGSTQIFSDDQGRFWYKDVSPTDVFRIYASTDDPPRRTNQQIIEKVAAGELYELVLVLHESSVTGRVVDAAGRPVSGAEVSAQPVKKVFHGIPTGRTDAAGRFTIAGLAEGEYVMKANWPGGRTPWPHDGPHVTLGPDDVRSGFTLVLTAEPGPLIAGRITDAVGTGVFDVHVSANLTYPPYHSQWARTDGEGHYAIEGLVEGMYMVTTSHPDFGNARLRGIAVGSTDANFVLEPRGAIAGAVIDAATGQPVVRFEVFETIPLSDLHHHSYTQQFLPVDDPKGQFMLEKVGPGETPVRVRAEGYAERAERVDVPPGAVAEALIALQRSRRIDGVVLDPAGEPVVGARIFAGKLPQETDRDTEQNAARSDERGRFVLGNVHPDEPLITCYHPRYAPSHAAVPATHEPVRIVLDEGVEIQGRVTMNGAPAPWAHVSVFYPALTASATAARVDEDGAYSLSSVAREGGWLSVGVPGQDGAAKRHLTRPVEAQPGEESLTIDIEIPTGPGVVEGTVFENGQPRGGLYMVLVLDEQGGWTQDFATHSATADGSYRFEGVPDGTGVVRVYPVGAPQEIDPVEVPVVVQGGGTIVSDVNI